MTNTKFMDAFKVPWKDAQTVSLTEKELDALMNVELDERLDNVRNLFVIQILTGLRYSDLKNLKPENIDLENEIIKISMIKTEDSVIIPISTKLRGYLKKYIERIYTLCTCKPIQQLYQGCMPESRYRYNGTECLVLWEKAS
jgi:integrase